MHAVPESPAREPPRPDDEPPTHRRMAGCIFALAGGVLLIVLVFAVGGVYLVLKMGTPDRCRKRDRLRRSKPRKGRPREWSSQPRAVSKVSRRNSRGGEAGTDPRIVGGRLRRRAWGGTMSRLSGAAGGPCYRAGATRQDLASLRNWRGAQFCTWPRGVNTGTRRVILA